MNKESSTPNKESGTPYRELPIVCVSTCVSRVVIQFLMAKNTSVVEIHGQLTEVYGSDIMSIQMVRKWCREFHNGWPGCIKVVMDESVNLIRTLQKNCRLTLQELLMIMNDDLGDPLTRMSISSIATNLGTQFYQSSKQKLVWYNKCLNLFDDYVEKWCTQKK